MGREEEGPACRRPNTLSLVAGAGPGPAEDHPPFSKTSCGLMRMNSQPPQRGVSFWEHLTPFLKNIHTLIVNIEWVQR